MEEEFGNDDLCGEASIEAHAYDPSLAGREPVHRDHEEDATQLAHCARQVEKNHQSGVIGNRTEVHRETNPEDDIYQGCHSHY